MKIKKGSFEYHISYGIHSNIPDCCIKYWLFDFMQSVDSFAENLALRRQSRLPYNYIPCLICIKKRKVNKLVRCETHKTPCCFIPKGRNWRKGPTEKITLTDDLVEATEKWIKKYYAPKD